jgi:hypothetical protein
MNNVLCSNMRAEESFSSKQIVPKWFKFSFAISLLGMVVYLPSLRNHFCCDDVDLFGSLCESIERGDTIKWLFSFVNGHLMVIPKIGYWINYLFFDRSIILWHISSLLLHAISVTSVFYIFYSFLGNFRLTILLSIVFATSKVYGGNILLTSNLNHLCAVTFTFLSLSLLCHYMRHGHWIFYLFSVSAAFVAILSSAFGLIAFPAYFMFAWGYKLKRGKSLVYSTSIVLTSVTFALFWFMGTKGETESHLNIFFGLYQTLLGITKVTVVKMLGTIGIPIFILSIINILRFKKNVNWRHVTVSLFLAVAPLFMALSFRADFINPYKWSRYHHIPVVGIILLIGLGLLTPNMEVIRKYFIPRKIGWYFLIAFFALNSGYVFHKNLSKATNLELRPLELRAYEDRLGEVCIQYAKLYDTKVVNVPNMKTSLPAFPFLRDLIYICRYSTPHKAHLQFKLQTDDKRLIEILKSNPKYEAILNRLILTE